MDYVRIQTKEIATEVKKELKALYPQTKFSVTSSFDSITVNYLDGAIANDIEVVVKKYNGHTGYDENYCDYTKNNPVLFRGGLVKTNLTYIHINRSFSPEFLNEVLDFVKANYGEPKHEVKIVLHQDGSAAFDGNDWDTLTVFGQVARRCDSFSPVAKQQEVRSQLNNTEFEQWKIAADLATKKLEEELESEANAQSQTNVVEFKPRKLNIEIITTAYPMEPEGLPFLQKFQVIRTQEFQPVSLNFCKL